MTENESDANDRWSKRYLRHTVEDMIAENGMDPERATVTDIDFCDGELRVRAVETPFRDAMLAEAKAIAEWAESDTEFIECGHGQARTAVFHGDGEIVVSTEANGEPVGDEIAISEEVAGIIAAARYLDHPEDETDG